MEILIKGMKLISFTGSGHIFAKKGIYIGKINRKGDANE
jgi:hypothetical protein